MGGDIFSQLAGMGPGWSLITTTAPDAAVYRSWVMEQAAQVLGQPVISLDGFDDTVIRATLDTSFLGDSCWYVLTSGAQSKRARGKPIWVSYHGPHRIIVLASGYDRAQAQQEGAQHICVLPDQWTQADVHAWVQRLVAQPALIDPRFIQQVFARAATYDFSTIRQLLTYGQFVGGRHEVFFATWYDKLVARPVMLYELLQYFFARDRRRFIRLWLASQEWYAAEFWTVFWTDTLFRAYTVLVSKQLSCPVDKKYTTRLPFSFLKKDYTLHKPADIMVLHDRIQALDRAFKKGADPLLLEVELGDYLAPSSL